MLPRGRIWEASCLCCVCLGVHDEGNAEGKVEGKAGGNADGYAKGNAKGLTMVSTPARGVMQY